MANYSDLLQIVQDAYNGQYRIDDVRKTLRAYQAAISNPAERVSPVALQPDVRFQEPTDRDKEIIASKNVKLPEAPTITLQDNQVAYVRLPMVRSAYHVSFLLQVQGLSSSLNLNQME